MNQRPPIDIIELFPELENQLIDFLKTLSREDWNRQTIAKQWKIKDVATHMLDGNFRLLSYKRDEWFFPPEIPIRSNSDLVAYLNELNADWVKATKRLSPALLVSLLEQTHPEVYKVHKSLDPFAPSLYPVSWAGENESQNWFDIAREYTERWLHQQQIRHAMGDTGIMTERLYHPLLDIFMQAWPFTCEGMHAAEGAVLKTTITGVGGGEWLLKRENGKWKMTSGKGEMENEKAGAIHAETIIDGAVAWQLFSKSVRKEDITGHYEIKGDPALGEKVLEMVSVMA